MSETNISFPTEDGFLRETSGQITVEWKIPKFFEKRRFQSKHFLLSDGEWFLEAYPNGDTRPDCQGCVCLFLCKEKCPTAVHVVSEIGIKKMDGSVMISLNFDAVFDDKQKGWGSHRFIKTADLHRSSDVVAPDGSVTFFCTARVRDNSSSADEAPASQKSSLSKVKDLEEELRDLKETVSALRKENNTFRNTIQEFEKKVKALEEKVEDLRDELYVKDIDYYNDFQILLQSENQVRDLKEKSRDLEETLSASRKENETFRKTMKEYEKSVLMLSQHFEELYLTGCQADVVINVKDTQFNVHRSVLAARSIVFRTMFEVDMAEKSNNSINIEEFEPSDVYDFLKFLYSGKFDVISNSNAVELYFIADKYNVNELKEPCVECLTREISLESIFGIIQLAKLHDEKLLLKTAKDYFLKNIHFIFSSPQWLVLRKEYPLIANELILLNG